VPVDLGAVRAEEHGRRRAIDLETLENFLSGLFSGRGPVEDEIFGQKLMKLGIVVELLTQQYAASSATRVEIDQDQLFFALGLGNGLVHGPLEPDLAGGRGNENNNRHKSQACFFHFNLLEQYP